MEYGSNLSEETYFNNHNITEPKCRLHISDIVDEIHTELDGLESDMKTLNILLDKHGISIPEIKDDSWTGHILTSVAAFGIIGTIALVIVFI